MTDLHLHKLILITWIASTISLMASGQIKHDARYEKEIKLNDKTYLVIPAEQDGLALIRQVEKYEHGNNFWEVIELDTALKEKWKVELAVDNKLTVLGYETHNHNLYVIFKMEDVNAPKLHIVKIQIDNHEITDFDFHPETTISYTHFIVLKDKVILGGHIAKSPAILMIDLASKKSKVIPGFFQPNTELLDVRTNYNNSFNILIAERNAGERKLIVRTYDENGDVLLDDVIAFDHDKSILAALTSTLQNDELIIIGTWGEKLNHQATGIFTVLADPFTEQKVNYYDFCQLRHFIDFEGPKRSARLKEKAKNKRAAGKIPEFRINATPFVITETKDGFRLLCEVYGASSNMSSNAFNSYGPYYGNNTSYPYYFPGSPYTNRYYNPYSYGRSGTPVQDYRLLESAVISFDLDGRLVSDLSMKLNDKRVRVREQSTDFLEHNGYTTLIYREDKGIHIQVSEQDGTIVAEDKIKPTLQNPLESIKWESEEHSGVKFWYENYFYIWGYQTIKNADGNRDVFYVNKLKHG